MIHQTFTYGHLPTYPAFEYAFLNEFVKYPYDNHTYAIRNDPYYGSGDLTCSDLYDALEVAVAKWESGNDAAGQFASSVLMTLGLEWV